ncbi:hypothetical protein IE81DRAFT_365490 [Ceraceosorus guamensis]|uniref:H-type lectin domain-containing protein n=1 Tax=Ceraceosorus guamensis TaxID=1522189 RepID=A0A316W2E9_9BASI|nr:hypothetical protein IE81DRAFT_365490 [Ceraceosorus guamensis]PWN43859.1 hypothetical protein IE81DRAFT_365490 [Ceraceosorus guamensis]
MSLLLAPYNNAMRIGQGFNSYTQQICIDDAVVVDPKRPENVINNAGVTMKMLAEHSKSTSALPRLRGLMDGGASQLPTPKNDVSQPLPTHPQNAAKKKVIGPTPPPAFRKSRAEPEPAGKSGTDAAKKNAEAMSHEEIKSTLDEIHANNDAKVAAGTMGVKMQDGEKELPWTPEQARGAAQNVEYQAKFVNKLSEITDDMSISGSLSIRYNAIGGSGSGSFFDAETFYDSDLVYYVSCRVTNSTLAYKDCLSFNPLRSCMTNEKLFNEVFGDSFISGFLEGGEFNAVICMKVHNKAKKRDIKAEAKVALTAGPVEVSAQGNVKLAEENVTNNVSTTIFVRWCGGGNVKAYDDEWTVESVLATAARFPALVGLYPQRTYAILTKYELLRSYKELKPRALSPLQYELAHLYTNMLADAYMEYKSLAKRITGDLADVQAGLKVIVETDVNTRAPLSSSLKRAGLTYFPATLSGLDSARAGIRKQMNAISQEVEALVVQPQLAVDPKHQQPFVGPASFASLVPDVDVKDGRRRKTAAPLDLPRINNVQDVTSAPSAEAEQAVGEDSLCRSSKNSRFGALSHEEQLKLQELEYAIEGIAQQYQCDVPIGDPSAGQLFTTLDFAQAETTVTDVWAIADDKDRLASLVIAFDNGLTCTYGKEATSAQVSRCPESHCIRSIDAQKQTVGSINVQSLETPSDGSSQIVGIEILVSDDKKLSLLAPSSILLDGQKLTSYEYRTLFRGGALAGFWGRCDESNGLHRLAPIWSRAVQRNVSGDKKAGPQSDRMLGTSKSEWVNSKTPRKIKYPIGQLLGVPQQLIHGPHYLKSSEKAKTDLKGLVMGGEIDQVDRLGFRLGTMTRVEQDALFVNWMVPPEIETVDVHCGSITTQPSAEPIRFPKAYGKDVKPDVRCWFSSISAEVNPDQSPPGKELYVRASIVKDSVTSESFRVVLEPSDGTVIFRKVVIGWLAHTHSTDKANASIVSGEERFEDFSSSRCIRKLEPSLESKPTVNFVGVNELRTLPDRPISFTSAFLPGTSNTELQLEYGNLGSGVKALGLTWILAI